MERRLAAIVCADVAGYSRMMGADEAGTHATFKAHRSAVYPVILNHGGRIVKNTGDGFLLEFPSIVGAIESAIAMQALMAERNSQLPADRVMQFRLGVHMGDVMADEDEVFGDDVNIAVRLETVAAPGRRGGFGKGLQRGRQTSQRPLCRHRLSSSQEYRRADPCLEPGSRAGSGDGLRTQDTSNLPAQYRTAIVGVLPFAQSQRQRRRIFFRRTDRGSDPRAVAAILLSGPEPEFDVLVQGQEPECAADRARDRRDVPDPGFGAALRKQDPRDRGADGAPKMASNCGPADMTGISAISSRCRMRSPPACPRRSAAGNLSCRSLRTRPVVVDRSHGLGSVFEGAFALLSADQSRL